MNLNMTMDDIKTLLYSKGIALVAGIAILLIAHRIGIYTRNLVFSRGRVNIQTTTGSNQQMNKTDLSKQLNQVRAAYVIVGNVVYYGTMIVALLIVLNIFGIESTSLVAMLGAAGFALGLALQGSFSDVSSGIIMGFTQVYTIGDLIGVDGRKGHVSEFTLMRTVITEAETGETIIIPNRTMMESTVTNYSRKPAKRVISHVSIANYYKDFDKLARLIEEEIVKHPNVIAKYKPAVEVGTMDIRSTRLDIHYSVDASGYPLNMGPVQTHIRQVLADNDVPLEFARSSDGIDGDTLMDELDDDM